MCVGKRFTFALKSIAYCAGLGMTLTLLFTESNDIEKELYGLVNSTVFLLIIYTSMFVSYDWYPSIFVGIYNTVIAVTYFI